MILSGMSITPAREKEIAMIAYQGETMKELSVVFWEALPEFSTLAELGTIAVQVGTFQEEYAKILGGHTKSLEATTEILLDLQYGKAQAGLMEPLIAKVMQQKMPGLQLVNIPIDKEHWTRGNGIGIRKDNHALIEKVARAVEELKEEGVISQLEKKWMVVHVSE
jgi:arginine transport system substrate-binding protein